MTSLRHITFPVVLTLVTLAALSTLACGAGESSPTAPSAASTLHNTLNAARSSANVEWRTSNTGTLLSSGQAFDDFVSPTTATITSLAWQGAYCDGRFNVPVVTPTPSATSFRVGFYMDRLGFPAFYPDQAIPASQVPLQGAIFSVAQAREQLDQVVPSALCGSRPVALYGYSVRLAPPVEVVAGQRYWLSIQATTTDAGIAWGWRVGSQDNSSSAYLLNGATTTRFGTDLAFSLSP